MAYKIPYLPCKNELLPAFSYGGKCLLYFFYLIVQFPASDQYLKFFSPAVTFNLYLHTLFHFLLHMCFSYFYIYIPFRKKCKYPCIKRSEKEGKMHPSYPQLHFCFLFYLLQIGNLAVKLL